MSLPKKLTDGYRSFVANRLATEQRRYQELADQGQSPQVMVIGCCDSRVSPTVIFDTGPGELFVVRNVANLVPPYSPDGSYHGVSAALEFAVHSLGVQDIVVLGHARCGGVRAFVHDALPLSPSDFIGRWISLIAPAAIDIGPRRDGEDLEQYTARLEQASLVRSIANLMTFPFVRTRVAAGTLGLHAAYFGVATGELFIYDAEGATFESVGVHPVQAE